jgi:hypothetical protein
VAMTGNGDVHDTETLLRDALWAQTSNVTPGPDFVNATIDHGVSSLRSTRRRQLALGAGATAAVVALLAWQAPSIVSHRSEQPTAPPGPTTVSDAGSWAQTLPRGADADVAYIDGHTLVRGSSRTELGHGTFGDLIATLPGGWFALIGSIDSNGDRTGPLYGELRPDGAFFPYEYQASASEVTGVAVSPGGTRVAYGDAVVDTGFVYGGGFDNAAMGTKVDSLPADASNIVEWNSAVLVYRDAHRRPWAWAPGTAAQRLPFDDVVAGGYAYQRDGDCAVIENYALNSAVRSYRLCGQGDPLAISSGKRALMSDGELVNLEAGVDFLTLPVGVLPEQLQLFWETDDNLILVVHDNVGETHAPVLVRCLVTAGRCERASDPLQSYPQLAALPHSLD